MRAMSIVLLVILVTVACGSDTPSDPAQQSATQTPIPVAPEATSTTTAGVDLEAAPQALAMSNSDVQETIKILENQFLALRTSDSDLFVKNCHLKLMHPVGGYNAVKAALEATWPSGGQDVRAENITVFTLQKPGRDPTVIVLGYDLIRDGIFESQEQLRFEATDSGGWISLSPICRTEL